MELFFTKMEGAGNDYIYIDCRRDNITLKPEVVRALCDRHRGIGGDGVIYIRRHKTAHGGMDMRNADATPGGMCGNGLRCVAKYLYDRGCSEGKTVRVATPGGIKTLEMDVREGAAVGATADMGRAGLSCGEVPVLHDGGNTGIPIAVNGREYRATCVSMGNPHTVIFTRDPGAVPLKKIGPLIETHVLFPDRTNVEFVRVEGSARLRMRVWERGAGETLACGTGACAAVVAAVLGGFCAYNTPVQVELPGGTLTVTYRKNGRVALAGPAREVFRGRMIMGEESLA